MHKRIRLNAAALAGLLIILFFLIIAVFAPVIAPYDPKEMIASYLPPSREHLLGTNDVGQDIFSEMVYGTRVSLYIGIFAAFIVTGVGTVLALVSGYFGGVTDKIITAITNIAMAVPSLPLTVLLVAYLNPGKWSLIIAIGVTAWTRYCKDLIPGSCTVNYVVNQKTISAASVLILFKRILPNIKDIILTRGAMAISGAMMTEAGLSFLGLGELERKAGAVSFITPFSETAS